MINDKVPADNERWLTDGNCGKCRRHPYCRKPCAKQKERKAVILKALIKNRTGLDRIQKLLEERQG